METLREREELHGFLVESVVTLEEYKSQGSLIRHIQSGCEVYHLANDDPENCFAYVFKTPPPDNSGLPHIMEHSVLAGSKNFPLKDPFQHLLKSSVYSFLNAMTYPDKTLYPASSPVQKDFFNLLEVYGDAVFFPLLKKETFWQEGWRFEQGKGNKLSLAGVVFNEMKGEYSSHDSITNEWCYRSLFPDTPYRFDSGGTPDAIPRLSYEQFMEFHRSYYSPANCRIFLYGNIPARQTLEFLDRKLLRDFHFQVAHTRIPDQPRWSAPRRLEKTSPMGKDESFEDKTSIVINWLLGQPGAKIDPVLALAREALGEILLGHVGSPLYKAIVESPLGEDLSPVSGIDFNFKDTILSVGIRGSNPGQIRNFEELILDELTHLVRQGIDAEVVEGALRTIEFHNREIKGGYPFGLRLMSRALRGWMYGDAPELTMKFTPWMEQLRHRVRSAQGFFEELIQSELLANHHRCTVSVKPDADHARKEEEELDRFITNIQEELRPEGIDALRREFKQFKNYLKRPDPQEVLAKLPVLSLEDLPKEVKRIQTEVSRLEGVTLFTHDLYTNGVAYWDLAFDLEGLEEEELMLVPLLTRVLKRCGLSDMGYAEVARLLALKTGGFSTFMEAASSLIPDQGEKSFLFIRVKNLFASQQEASELIGRILLEADLDDAQRIKDITLELKNDFKASIVRGGNVYAASRAGSRVSRSLAKEELWDGISQFLFLDSITKDIDRKLIGLSEALKSLRSKLFIRQRVSLNITAQGKELEQARRFLKGIITTLPSSAVYSAENVNLSSLMDNPPLESLILPTAVGYCAAVIPCSRMDQEAFAHETLLAQVLETGYLWERIRMRNGAYGLGAYLNGSEGFLTIYSYRDPNVVDTLNAVKEALQACPQFLTADSIERSKVGTIGRDLRPLAPGEKSVVGFRRKLFGVEDDMRQQRRQGLFKAEKKDLLQAAERLLSQLDKQSTVIVVGPDYLPAKQQNLFHKVTLPL